MIGGLLLRERSRAPEAAPATVEEEADEEEEGEPERPLCCAACRVPITHERERVVIDGRPLHSFPNPHGILFHFACYREAPGCAPVGAPSAFFSWFPGHRWQIQQCGRCAAHLGWRFEGERRAFYGLLEGRLTPCEE